MAGKVASEPLGEVEAEIEPEQHMDDSDWEGTPVKGGLIPNLETRSIENSSWQLDL